MTPINYRTERENGVLIKYWKYKGWFGWYYYTTTEYAWPSRIKWPDNFK